MTFSEQIKARRTELELTQKEVARRCGVAQTTYAQYEAGNRNPKLETMQKIMDALEMELLPGFSAQSPEKVQDARAKRLVSYYEQLNNAGRKKALEALEILIKVPDYNKADI